MECDKLGGVVHTRIPPSPSPVWYGMVPPPPWHSRWLYVWHVWYGMVWYGMVWVCLRLDTLQTTVWPSFFLLQSSISPLLPVFANNTKLCKTDEILTICCSICTLPLPHIRCLDLEVQWQNRLHLWTLISYFHRVYFCSQHQLTLFNYRIDFEKVICRCQVTSEPRNLIWCLKSDCSAADMLSISTTDATTCCVLCAGIINFRPMS